MDYKAISIEFRVPNSINSIEISGELQYSKQMIENELYRDNIIDRPLTHQEMLLLSSLAPFISNTTLKQIISNVVSNNPEEITVGPFPSGNYLIIKLLNEQENV